VTKLSLESLKIWCSQ